MEPLVYLNGRFVPFSQAALPIHDAGLVSGVTVTDFCRTFGQRLFRWPDHLARFCRDCASCFIPLVASEEQLTQAALHLLHHHTSLWPDRELALVTFATPGPLGRYLGEGEPDGPPSLVMHAFPLSLRRYQHFFTHGISLAVAGHHATDAQDLAPPRVKHRSRLHWWRAEQLLRQRRELPSATLPLLLDRPGGNVTETAIGNLLIVRQGIMVTPPRGSVLDGISLRVVRECCARQNLVVTEKPLTLEQVQHADEVMLTGTAFGLAGVRWIDGQNLPWPGPITRELQQAFSDEVGVDFVAQILAASS